MGKQLVNRYLCLKSRRMLVWRNGEKARVSINYKVGAPITLGEQGSPPCDCTSFLIVSEKLCTDFWEIVVCPDHTP